MPDKNSKAGAVSLLSIILFSLIGLQPVAAQQALQPDQHGFVIGTPDKLVPADGGRSINIIGNPSEEGLYVIRITFPPGSGSRPHFHSTARYITVIKGTWWVASGPDSDVYDPDSMQAVPAGTFIYQPPAGHHYDMAKDEEVTVQIMGMGPVVTTSIPQAGDQ
ncbi:MAG: cupin domain-containing protein [Gammaproteobacteria bacterium]|nr:cupin domain-containing protein [Pseudomonadales bacterium]MCP5348663.1 cupin domain-containing protein [Pseudomonadales bacterium]